MTAQKDLVERVRDALSLDPPMKVGDGRAS